MNNGGTRIKSINYWSLFREQFNSHRNVIGILLLVSVAGIGLTVSIHYLKGIPIMDLTRDPSAVTETSIFIGFLSYIGLALWISAASVALLTWGILQQRNRLDNQFLLLFGLFSLFLWLDDTYLLHEEVFPRYLPISQTTVYILYLLVMASLLIVYFFTILKSPYIYLGIALILLGSSVLLDNLFPLMEWINFYEDALKFSGLIFWTSYFWMTSRSRLLKL